MLVSPSGIGCGRKLVELEKYVTHFFGDKLKRDAGIGVSVGEKGRGLSEESLSSTMTFFFSSSTFSVAIPKEWRSLFARENWLVCAKLQNLSAKKASGSAGFVDVRSPRSAVKSSNSSRAEWMSARFGKI